MKKKKQKLHCLQVKKITLVSFLFKSHLELKHHGLIEKETVTTAGPGHSEHPKVVGVKNAYIPTRKVNHKTED